MEEQGEKRFSFIRHVFQSLPELFVYAIWTGLLLMTPAYVLVRLFFSFSGLDELDFDRVDWKAFFESRYFNILLIGVIIWLFLFFIFGVLVRLRVCRNIAKGKRARYWHESWYAVRCLFRGRLFENFPFRKVFPRLFRFLKERGFAVFVRFVWVIIAVLIIEAGLISIYMVIPNTLLSVMEQRIPFGYVVSEESLFHITQLTQLDRYVILYRILCAEMVFFGNLTILFSLDMSLSVLTMRFVDLYMKYRDGKEPSYGSSFLKKGYDAKLFFMLWTVTCVIIVCAFLGYFYNPLFTADHTLIVAHRAGGVHASENSLEGIEYAVASGCYASEIDVQRSKDGIYVINHDASFARLTGRNGIIADMNWDYFKNWLIKDTTGNGQVHSILRLADMLDATLDREKLFIELKGTTADEKMVDELVTYTKSLDCVDQVVLISFARDAIEYAEEKYPEYETGLLVSSNLQSAMSTNCDMVLMKYSLATYSNIQKIHSLEKEVGVWTVNDAAVMNHMIRCGVDYLITDEIDLVKEVRKKYDERSDREHMVDVILFGMSAKKR
jgi:glycerophosphoryl diester phosphodiesterase